MDKEKIIEKLEKEVKRTYAIKSAVSEEITEHREPFVTLTIEMADKILALLNGQEAVEPKISESYRTNSGRMSRRKAWCGACGIGINMDAKFCDHCGKAVKWNDKRRVHETR